MPSTILKPECRRVRQIVQMFRIVVPFIIAAAVCPAGVRISDPAQEAFAEYARQVESRRDRSALDRVSGLKNRVLAGEVVAVPFAVKSEGSHASVPVAGGLINHWLGAMYLPGVTVDQVRAVLQDYPNYRVTYATDITESKLLNHAGSEYDIFLRLNRTVKVPALLGYSFPVEFNANFHVEYRDAGAGFLVRSVSTRIAEVRSPKKSHSDELPPGDDSGYLWRLNSYWRVYPENGGVIAECEAVSLSRSVPGFVEKLVTYFTTNFPEDSMRNTLKATKAALTGRSKPQ